MSALSARRARRIGATAAAITLAGLAISPSLAAAATTEGSGVDVVNTETIQVYLGADGHLESKRVYEQLALTGHGPVDLLNPVSTDGLRNIDGFGGFKLDGSKQVIKTTVDGTKQYRSVSNYDGALPVSVTPTYTLDGKTVKPGDVVGKSGKLRVDFTVANKTVTPKELTFDDGAGGTITKTVNVPVPLVGQLTTTLPKSFTEVKPDAVASAAGDGTGGTALTYNMTLFPPIGETTTTFGYSATIKNGVVPRVEVGLLPVDPLASPTFKTASDGYSTGATTGAELVSGASQIDSNLLKLRDGASTLVAGLLKLSDGADQLHSGLADDAAPGARKLAAGAKQLSSGASQVNDGAGQLHQGTSDALAGADQLKDGLGQISGGLSQLADQLPAAGPGIQQLIDGVNQITAGFGAAGQAGTLIDGLTQLNAGATALKTGLTGQVAPGIGQAKAGVDQVRAGLNAAVTAGGSIDQLLAGLNAIKNNALPGMDCGPVCQGTLAAGVIPGVQQSKTDLSTAYAGLGLVSGGLQQVLDGLNGQIVPGLTQLEGGAAAAKAGAAQLKAGNQQVADGLTELKGKLAAAIAGVLQLNSGAADAYAGSGDLASGLGQLDAGTGDLADGTAKLSSGASQVSGGAGDLADGLGTAADGSGQIADGLKQASGKAPEIPDGANRLSKEGTSKIVTSGKETVANYGQLYAELAAGAKRAQTESMAFGAPAGAEGLTAYSFVIRGDDGESSRNVTRSAAALALVALATGVSVLRRRMVAA
ncbi:hypothetical protein [Nocardioides marmorisolisilvae]|uniref:Choice-of-anchor G family protein n=1 Tax=Nocardioides marmorisolisilvae TaxID=1542737 RepID=A0A3N0DVL6_9ACTN|nr:hypothetical protein [Nocardioides marmorisolisilvae]RNL79659.1 hypothetical protein EFL95_11870 [Nocardioides marmorisolisilvae]